MGVIKHGMCAGRKMTREYRSWNSMTERCNCKTSEAYPNYGGKGIKVCKRWQQFENFHADMGDRPKGTSLDRINNDGDYTPKNCRWATRRQQQNNRKNNRHITYKGQSLTVAQWSRRTVLSYATIIQRLNRGWPPKKIFITPVRGQ